MRDYSLGGQIRRLAALLLLVPVQAWSFSSSDRGITVAPFLEIGPGARPAAMGEAFSAVADDIHAAYYNPAGLGAVKTAVAAGSHDDYLQGVKHEFAAVAVPLLSFRDSRWSANRFGVAAFSVTSLAVGGIERRGTTETDAPEEIFSSQDFAYALSYGYAFPEIELALGATVKFIDLNLDSSHARGLAFDGGGLWTRERLSMAAGFRHLGALQRLAEVRDPLPLTAFGGLAYRWPSGFLASGELSMARGNDPRGSIGAEYRRDFTKTLGAALRGGYNMRAADAGGPAGFSLGAGINYAALSLDFAWVALGDLGDAFRYSFSVRF